MDGPVFDALLKTALEEALRRDMEEAPDIPAPSRRQRKRMRCLLAGYGPGAEWTVGPEAARKHRNPIRWLSVAIIAALLTGAAAVSLGGGEYFRQVFAESHWAGDYGTAADTEQLLGMGVETGAGQAEAGGLRVEILDAVFDGQIALFAIRVTVLDQALLERLREENGELMFGRIAVSSEDGDDFGTFSNTLLKEDGEGRYSADFSILNEALGSAGLCRIEIGDLVLFPRQRGLGEVLREGPWTLSAAPRPTEVLRLTPGRVCRVDGENWVLDRLTLTPLAIRLTMRQPEGASPRTENWAPGRNLIVHMKDGSDVAPAVSSRLINSGGGTLQVDSAFPMPLDLTQVEYLRAWGEEIDLEE